MILQTLKTISPELIGIVIGFLIRHFFMPFVSGKETSNLIKYLKAHLESTDQKAELKYNLAEAKFWNDFHAHACPYVAHELKEAKNTIKKLANKMEG